MDTHDGIHAGRRPQSGIIAVHDETQILTGQIDQFANRDVVRGHVIRPIGNGIAPLAEIANVVEQDGIVCSVGHYRFFLGVRNEVYLDRGPWLEGVD